MINKKQSWFERYPYLTFLIFFIFVLIVIEIFLRIFFSDLTQVEHIVKKDEYVYKNHFPNTISIRKPSINDSFPNTINIFNSMGIRGPEIGKKNKYRILNIGDSFIEADEVRFGDTFGELLNKTFKDKQFISHGVSSWSPTLELSWIYHNYNKIQFDEVNLFLCVNDFYRAKAYKGTDAYYRKFAIYNKDGIAIRYKGRSNSIKSFKSLLEHIELYRLIYFVYKFYTPNNKILTIKKSNIKPGGYVNEILLLDKNVTKWPVSLKNNVDITLDVIKKMKIFLDDNNVKLNVTLLPLGFAWKNEVVFGKTHPAYGWKKDFTVQERGLENYLKQYLKNNDINYFNLIEYFHDYKLKHPNILLYNEQDGHWNKYGHELVYRFIKTMYEK